MGREKRTGKTYCNYPEVRFQLVSKESSQAQVEAGKRLFKKIVARAQSRIGKTSLEEK